MQVARAPVGLPVGEARQGCGMQGWQGNKRNAQKYGRGYPDLEKRC